MEDWEKQEEEEEDTPIDDPEDEEDEAESPRSKFKYEVGISQKSDGKVFVSFMKNYGNMNGGCDNVDTPEEAVKLIQKQIKNWEGFDSIVNRTGDKVRKNNLSFTSNIPGITVGKLFNETNLTEWFK